MKSKTIHSALQGCAGVSHGERGLLPPSPKNAAHEINREGGERL